jgi:hypothetical protein
MAKPRYQHETLVVTAAFAASMTDFLEKLGVPPTPSRRRVMWARLISLDIDVSHRDRTSRGSYSSEDLAAAVAASLSTAEVMRRLGIKPAGGSHFHITKRIKREGLDTSHFRRQAINRGRRGPRRPAAEILVQLPPDAPRTKRQLLVRAMLESGVPYVCSMAGATGPGGVRGSRWLLIMSTVTRPTTAWLT